MQNSKSKKHIVETGRNMSTSTRGQQHEQIHEVMQTETMNRHGLQRTHRLNTLTLMTRRGTGEEREEGGGQVR